MRAANKRLAAERNAESTDESGRRRNAAKAARRMAESHAEAMPVVEALDGPRHVRVVNAPLQDPAPPGGIVEVFRESYALRLIVRRELAQLYAASALGLLWSYVQPAMRFGVYYLVMGILLGAHRSTPNFAIHMLTAMVMVHYFAESWIAATKSIWSNRSLITKMRMAREMFPVASVVVGLYHTVPQIVLLIVVAFVAGWNITWGSLFAGFLGTIILGALAMALSMFFSAFNVFYRDFQNIVHTVTQFLHFLVPMVYPFSRVVTYLGPHPLFYKIYLANPLTIAVLLMQKFFWWGTVRTPSQYPNQFPSHLIERGIVMALISVALLYASQRYFAMVENKFPERM